MNIKQLTFISIFAALTVVIYTFLPIIYLFVFILVSLSLNKQQSLIYGLAIGSLIFLVSGITQTLANVLWLPLIAYSFKLLEKYIYGGYLKDGCLSGVKRMNKFKLGLVAFLFIGLANLGSELIAMLVLGLGFEYLIASSPIIIGGALLNSLLVGLLGVSVQKRLSKYLYKLEL
jgi:hypothetical protein